ncbi:MerR family transcriptional regulator [Streptomyces celluloflavus]|uniref:MerR family transcriptional regulator n=1 Tax=Streptomyces celluloflavus TaxID=58344 RepID=UPI00366179B3
MDHGDDGLLRIGTFSTLSRISVRMLRHYQEHGVLAPALVDPFSGHRYYRSDQLAQAHLTVQLRDAGFPVEAIARLLASTADPSRVDAALDARREELSRRREELHAQLVALDQVRSTLKGHPKMTDVTVKTLPEMVTASLRRVVPRYGDEGTLWQEIMPLLQRAGAPFPAGGISGATFHDPEHRESDVDIEVWVQVAETFAPAAPLVCQAGARSRDRDRDAHRRLRADARRDGRARRLPRRAPHGDGADVQHLPGQPGPEPRPRQLDHRHLLPRRPAVSAGRYGTRRPSRDAVG